MDGWTAWRRAVITSPGSYADVALVQAAIEAYDEQLAVEQTQFYASAVRGRPQVRTEVGRSTDLRYRGHSYSPKTYRLGPQQYRVEVNGSRIEAQIERRDQFEYWLTTFGRRFHVISVRQGLSYRIEVDGVSHQIDRDDGGIVHASSPAVVVSIAVKAGDTVSVGDRLACVGSDEDGNAGRGSIFRKSPASDDHTKRTGGHGCAPPADRARRSR